MNEINEKLGKLKVGSSAESIRNDLSKGRKIFSGKTSRAVHEMGNMELIELKQTSGTIQCPSCLKHVPGIDRVSMQHLASTQSKYDGHVLDLFLSQSCGFFLSCDISTVTVLICGSRKLPCCFVVWQFVFAQQKNMYQTIFMRCTII